MWVGAFLFLGLFCKYFYKSLGFKCIKKCIKEVCEMGTITVLTRASSKHSESLRTTVPIFIIRHFGLRAGDELEWELQAINNQINIVVKPRKVKK